MVGEVAGLPETADGGKESAGITGARLAQGYFTDVVGPLLADVAPGIPYAAGRLGSGSDVLGLDDETSRDHDWGLRLTLLVPAEHGARIDALLAEHLPDTYAGWPTRSPTTWDPSTGHNVEVADPVHFAVSRLGIDPARLTAEPRLWLGLTGQSVLEVVAGPVFVDLDGRVTAIRRALTWYPDDVWLHVLAADWQRIGQELPFVGRTADVGDDLGSQVIAGRLARTLLHLACAIERTWPPYAKWLGTRVATLATGEQLRAALADALSSPAWQGREAGLVSAVTVLWERQRALGLPVATAPTEPFWDRPYRTVPETAVAVLVDAIADPDLRGMPRAGSVEQWVDSVDVLVDPHQRTRLSGC